MGIQFELVEIVDFVMLHELTGRCYYLTTGIFFKKHLKMLFPRSSSPPAVKILSSIEG